jgi:hypothetical protein
MNLPEAGYTPANPRTINCGDAKWFISMITDEDVVIIDPPWDMPELFAVGSAAKNKIVFCDGMRMGDAIRHNGAPTWVFCWDCVSCWYTPNRPLKRAKYALWYGEISSYNQDGCRHGEPCGKPRMVKNSRGRYMFTPHPDGKMLADVYQQPITRLRSTQKFNHSKPLDWICMIIGNCRGNAVRVFDLFAGSGVCAVAASKLGMGYFGVEIDEGRAEEVRSLIESGFIQADKQEQSSWL